MHCLLTSFSLYTNHSTASSYHDNLIKPYNAGCSLISRQSQICSDLPPDCITVTLSLRWLPVDFGTLNLTALKWLLQSILSIAILNVLTFTEPRTVFWIFYLCALLLMYILLSLRGCGHGGGCCRHDDDDDDYDYHHHQHHLHHYQYYYFNYCFCSSHRYKFFCKSHSLCSKSVNSRKK